MKKSQLHDLTNDLREVYGLLDDLCSQLKGGGIVQARDVEPAISQAMPRLRRAVIALNAETMIANDRERRKRQRRFTSPGQNPLLI